MKSIKLAGEAGPVDQAAEEFLKHLLSVAQEKGSVEEHVCKGNETGCFYKDISKRALHKWDCD